jgi:quercetin dioxygenase-like cupin family protein
MPTAAPGEVITLTSDTTDAEPKPQMIVKAERFRVMRLVLPAGKAIAQHQAPGEITVQCLSGRVDFTTMGQTRSMTAGTLLYLEAAQPHALTAIDDSIMIVTLSTVPS